MNPFELAEAGDAKGIANYIASDGELDVQCSDTGESLLSIAVNRRDPKLTELLLSSGCDPNFTKTVSLPLVTAAGSDQFEVVNLLLAHGADVSLSDDTESTALTAAAASGNLQVLEALLAAGANPKQKDPSGDTAIIVAAEKNHREICERLYSLSSAKDRNQAKLILELNEQGPPSEEVEELIRMAGFGAMPVVKGWIEDDGIPVDSINTSGETALMSAATGGRLKMVKYLIEKGADVNRKNRYGDFALLRAAWGAWEQTYDFLYPLTDKRLRHAAEKAKQLEIELNRWPRDSEQV